MRKFLPIVLAFLMSVVVSAKEIKRPTSFNYLRAEEAVDNGDVEEALQYLQKELADNPKNGYAYFRMAWIFLQKDENGQALTNIEKALKLLPKKDGEYVAYSHNVKAMVYNNLGQKDKCIEELGLAIAAQPEDIDYLNFRGQRYYEMKKYDLSNADYLRITKIDQGSTVGFLGLGRNATEQKNFAEAEKNFDHALKLSPDETQVYCFRAECYIGQKKWGKAIDDIVKSISLGGDAWAMELMSKIDEEPQFSQLISRLKTEAKKDPTEMTWYFIAGSLCAKLGKPQDAIPFFKKLYDIGNTETASYLLASAYSDLGMYDEAMKNIDNALEEDSTDINYHWQKSHVAHCMGDVKGAITSATKMVDNASENDFSHQALGTEMMRAGLYNAAIDDFDTAISIDGDNTNSYLYRGYCNTKLGNTDAARADYEKVIEIDSVPATASEAMFAYAMLGNREKAVEMCDSVLANDSSIGMLYNASCLYSRLNDPKMACQYLRKVFEKGVFELGHIDTDFDMDNVRDNEEFKQIMQEQRKKVAEIVAKLKEKSDEIEYEDEEVEVPFTKEGNLYRVKCSINDLPLSFIFDTGASDVCLSMVEATFMMKNGYLSKSDVIGSANFTDANGNVSAGTVINLRNVNFGGLSIDNVRANVVRNQKAPLLLGQTVLNRVGKIEIDKEKKVLKITHKVQK